MEEHTRGTVAGGVEVAARPPGGPVPAGDAAFEAGIAAHRACAQKALRRVLGRSADEEDLVQEVLTRLLIRLRQPGEVCVEAWCRRTARNVAIDHARRRRAAPTDSARLDRGHGDGLDHEVIGLDVGAKLVEALRDLPDRHRRVLMAQFGHGDRRPTHATLGESLGLSAKATESLLARARQRLRVELRRAGVQVGGIVAICAGLGRWLARGSRRRLGLHAITTGAAATKAPLAAGTLALVALASIAILTPWISQPPASGAQRPEHTQRAGAQQGSTIVVGATTASRAQDAPPARPLPTAGPAPLAATPLPRPAPSATPPPGATGLASPPAGPLALRARPQPPWQLAAGAASTLSSVVAVAASKATSAIGEVTGAAAPSVPAARALATPLGRLMATNATATRPRRPPNAVVVATPAG